MAQRAPLTLPTLDVRADFGARGDGKTDDSPAFDLLAREVNRRGGGVRIVIPRGEYLVGGQVENEPDSDGNICRFLGLDVLMLRDCSRPVQIEASGAVLRLPDGLKFGSFDSNGNALRPPLPFYDLGAAGTTGFLVGAVRCADVSITGLELDGRNTTYVLGGAWGDKDRQCRSYGFMFDSCGRVELDGVSVHHFGLDGLSIKAVGLRAIDQSAPHTLRNCRFQWNGRQGLSWSGGIGLRATDCLFSNTGYAQNRTGEFIYNTPGAGVDVEAENSVCRDGEFVRCQFVHTRGPALYAQVGDNAGITFRDCTFWNFDNYSLVPDAPRLSFFDCQILGTATGVYSSATNYGDATQFWNCTFEDRVHRQWGQPFSDAYGSLLSFDGLNGGVQFNKPRFVAHSVKGPFLRSPRPDQTRGFFITGGELHLERWNGANESLATLQGGHVRGLKIETDFKTTPPAGLYVWTNHQTSFEDTELNGHPVDNIGDRLLLAEGTP